MPENLRQRRGSEQEKRGGPRGMKTAALSLANV